MAITTSLHHVVSSTASSSSSSASASDVVAAPPLPLEDPAATTTEGSRELEVPLLLPLPLAVARTPAPSSSSSSSTPIPELLEEVAIGIVEAAAVADSPPPPPSPPLTPLNTPQSSALNLLPALLSPAKRSRSRTSMPLAYSLMARLPSLSCKSCHPASSAATTCCV